MVSNALFLLIVLVFIDSVFSGTVSIKVREEKSIEPTYPFNHPPSAEYYNPIPVAVVYENENNYLFKTEITEKSEASDRDEKYESKKKPLLNEENISEKVTKNILNTTYTNLTPHINSKNNTNSELIAKPRALNDLQIPVAVVYDSESFYQNYLRTKTSNKTDAPKPYSNFARKKQTEKESQVSNVENENSQSSIQEHKNNTSIRTFKKRTEGPDPVVPIIDMESYVFSHNGNFRYSYEGGDGTKAFSEGKQITVDDGAGESVKGGFSYKDKEGNDFSLTYTADENGYRPTGDHLPTPPPIPPAIARALAYLATATSEPVTKPPKKS